MVSDGLREKYIKDAAYFAWLNRTREGKPGGEHDDWAVGRLEALRHFEMADLCARLLHCGDVGKKIELAVMFFAAEAVGWRIEPIDRETPLPNEREKVKNVWRQASFAATNLDFPFPQGVWRVGEMIEALKDAYRKFNGKS
jgi:hypothetical protein